MILIIAEKPKVAERIAHFLGKDVKVKRIGNVKTYRFFHNGEEVVVAPAVGHLFTVAEKKKTSGYPALETEWVPIYKAEKNATYTKQYLDVLKNLCQQADVLICATDYDVEGSLIGYKIATHLFHNLDKVKRMKFSAITPADIRSAYSNLLPMDVNNALAGEVRHELDWLYGINLSRALMQALKRVGRFKILSIGRVQGPALAILAEREAEIHAFKPKPYWQLLLTASGLDFQHKKERFWSEGEAKAAKARLTDKLIITKCEKRTTLLAPPPAFDLTTLQTEAYNIYKFSPAYTLQLAQSLYENGYISYPRTTSQKLPSTLPLKQILAHLADLAPYRDFARSAQARKPVQGKKDDPAHPAIHPTGQIGEMNRDEKKLYDLIVRRFLAAFLDPSPKINLAVEGESGGEPFVFKHSFIQPSGWILAYPFVDAGKKLELAIKEGARLPIEKARIVKKETKPPKRYSPASIIKELEKRNLGTKATRAVILETLYKRGYIKGKRAIEVTPFGMAVYKALRRNAPLILDEGLTRKIEGEMEKIERGELAKERVLEEGKEALLKILTAIKEKEREMGKDLVEGLRKAEQIVLGKCACGGEIRVIQLKNTRFAGCSNYPKCKNTLPLPQKGEITPTNKCCPNCGTPVIKIKLKGKQYETCLSPECWKRDKEGKIPKS